MTVLQAVASARWSRRAPAQFEAPPRGTRLAPTPSESMREVTMRTVFSIIAPAIALMAAGCAASFPPPTQRMADAESAARSAREVGAESNPAARLEVKLASEEIAQAKA